MLDPREIAMHSEQRVRMKTPNRFFYHVIDAIKNGWSKDLASCYRKITSLGRLKGAFETKLGANYTYISIQCS